MLALPRRPSGSGQSAEPEPTTCATELRSSRRGSFAGGRFDPRARAQGCPTVPIDVPPTTVRPTRRVVWERHHRAAAKREYVLCAARPLRTPRNLFLIGAPLRQPGRPASPARVPTPTRARRSPGTTLHDHRAPARSAPRQGYKASTTGRAHPCRDGATRFERQRHRRYP